MARRNWLDRQTTRRVLVQSNEKPADSIEGVLATVSPDGIVLAHAVFLGESGERIPLTGEVWIPRPKVRFVQTLPPEGLPS